LKVKEFELMAEIENERIEQLNLLDERIE